MKFYFSFFIMTAISLFLLLWPTLRLIVHNGTQTPISRVIYSVCVLVGVFGVSAGNAFSSLNRRLKALEGTSSSKLS
jgi:hypothetical protein